ncbi:non-canonical purine NTP pyrophosphatase [Arthrobacter sp. Soil736]|uniref:RdgB/HAM1 family non-canonical purine NTP pyrophosphatase n=1 Tax=Arthrobacter sp. Soil736 TaxID=1736395 RepID=UPI0006FD4334|nr:RdgB/HAM1 family non-canonical purine NTP pyrophosphatase [Arthrobacter sp. Soil736]KRE50459.1 non-canonical purine NTP pyrophosphatase [Arthrobacter sp. Soil736]
MTENSAVKGRGSEAPVPRLVLATHNKGKLRELRELLRGKVPGLDVDTQVVDASAVGGPDVAETGVTFAENSLLKARAVAEATGLVAIADDSGLSVDVLGGAPGIFSARWAGRHGDDDANLRLLLAQLADVRDPHRGAAFVCAAALAVPAPASEDGVREVVEYGQLAGTLLREPRGEGGFGYDPVLQPLGLDRSCAELSPEEKNAISHRGQAFRALLPAIVEALGGH